MPSFTLWPDLHLQNSSFLSQNRSDWKRPPRSPSPSSSHPTMYLSATSPCFLWTVISFSEVLHPPHALSPSNSSQNGSKPRARQAGALGANVNHKTRHNIQQSQSLQLKNVTVGWVLHGQWDARREHGHPKVCVEPACPRVGAVTATPSTAVCE